MRRQQLAGTSCPCHAGLGFSSVFENLSVSLWVLAPQIAEPSLHAFVVGAALDTSGLSGATIAVVHQLVSLGGWIHLVLLITLGANLLLKAGHAGEERTADHWLIVDLVHSQVGIVSSWKLCHQCVLTDCLPEIEMDKCLELELARSLKK